MNCLPTVLGHASLWSMEGTSYYLGFSVECRSLGHILCGMRGGVSFGYIFETDLGT